MILVRNYKSTDAKALAEIYYNTIHRVNSTDYTKEQLDAWAAPWSSEQEYSEWAERLEKTQPFVALIEEAIVGFAEFEPNGHIDCFYVHHAFQGVGVGTALMRAIENEAREKSLPRIYAEVSITAKSFFETKGFHVVKQQTVKVRGVALINFAMKKDYYQCKFLSSDGIPLIVSAFNSIGWDKPVSLFKSYVKEMEAGERLVWVIFVHDRFAGYITLKWQSSYALFKEQSIPEIMDLNVLPHARKRGIGSLLLARAEKEAATKSHTVGIGVGLYAGSDGGYGMAQRLYVKRGYIPDGKGVTYNYASTTPGESYPLDDDLVLWFTKKLR